MNPLPARIISYLEGLITPQGRYQGKPLVVWPWQRRFLKGAFSQPGDAALTLARGGGKTTLTAGIAAASIDVGGPLVVPAAETMLVASSFSQGGIAFRHVLRFMQPTFDKYPRRFRVQDSANLATIQDRETGAMLRVIGSDPKRAHGAAPMLLIFDELAQWPPGQIDAMLAALETSKGKIPDSKALWIGTRAASPQHPFEKALNGGAPYSQIHAARKGDPPFRRSTWKRANPGLEFLPDLELVIRQEAKRAKVDPDQLASFEALRLNMGVSDVLEQWLLDPALWERLEADTPKVGRYVLGLDLGTSAAMSAAAAFWPETGVLEGFAAFPEVPDLHDRGIRDGCGPLYTNCARRGELITAGRLVSDVGALLRESLARWGSPGLVVADRWRKDELRQELEKVGFPFCPMEVRGMGFMDGGEDVRDFRAACLSEAVHPHESLLLRSALAEARTVTDAAGNSKLSKAMQGGRRMRARDDVIAAAILAIAAGWRRKRRGPPVERLTHVIV